jgi:hypothetical protein
MTSHSEVDEVDYLHHGNGGTQRRDDPTPTQILERCREIQATWTEEDRVRRERGGVDHFKPRRHWSSYGSLPQGL